MTRQTTPLRPAPARPHEAAWEHAVTDFSDHLGRQGHPSPETASDYCRRVLTYARDLPCDPWTLSPEILTADLQDRNWSRATRKAVLVAMRRFYSWAVKAGRVERSPLVGVPDGTPKRPGPLAHSPAAAWHVSIYDYLTSVRAAGRRPATIAMRRGHLNRLSQEFAHPWRVTGDDLALFLSNPDWAPEYRRSVRGSIRVFYRWAVLSDRLDRDPTMSLAAVTVPRALPRPAPDSAVLDALDRADRRTRIAIELGMYAGLRIGEVVQLHESDVLADQIRVTGKGGHQRFVPLHPTLAHSLAAERSRRVENGERSPWLFPSRAGTHLQPNSLGVHVNAALPDGWTHHTLRHRFATQAYESNRDLRAVQELLGHSKPETTARYAAVPQDALTSAVAGVGLTLDRNRKADQ